MDLWAVPSYYKNKLIQAVPRDLTFESATAYTLREGVGTENWQLGRVLGPASVDVSHQPLMALPVKLSRAFCIMAHSSA